MQDRFAEMQKRMLRNYMATGVTMIVAAPLLFFLAPAGLYIGTLVGVLGILSVVRASTLGKK
ncbi:MAG: hypothetical protein ABI867_37885 [Kofleriaceae bacterium]